MRAPQMESTRDLEREIQRVQERALEEPQKEFRSSGDPADLWTVCPQNSIQNWCEIKSFIKLPDCPKPLHTAQYSEFQRFSSFQCKRDNRSFLKPFLDLELNALFVICLPWIHFLVWSVCIVCVTHSSWSIQLPIQFECMRFNSKKRTPMIWTSRLTSFDLFCLFPLSDLLFLCLSLLPNWHFRFSSNSLYLSSSYLLPHHRRTGPREGKVQADLRRSGQHVHRTDDLLEGRTRSLSVSLSSVFCTIHLRLLLICGV